MSPIVVEDLAGSLDVDDPILQQIRALLGQVDMKDRVFGTQPPGYAFRVPWPRRPAVAQPDRDRVACRSGRVAAGVQRQFSPEFGFPVDESDAVQNLLDRRAEKLVASRGDFDLALA